MNRAHFAEGQVLFREGDPADSVFRLLSGAVDILRDLDGDPILLGTIGAGQFIGEMGVVENRPRNATARAASEVEVEILTPTEFFDQITGSPRAVRELIQRLSRRLREADDRIVNDERRSGRAQGIRKDADSQTAIESVKNAYLAAKNPWLAEAPRMTNDNIAMAEAVSKEIQKLLRGLGPKIQGAVLADLLSLWLAGHFVARKPAQTSELREALLIEHITTVRKLVSESEKEIIAKIEPEGSG
jgi:CRP-like cAMP-binding protein